MSGWVFFVQEKIRIRKFWLAAATEGGGARSVGQRRTCARLVDTTCERSAELGAAVGRLCSVMWCVRKSRSLKQMDHVLGHKNGSRKRAKKGHFGGPKKGQKKAIFRKMTSPDDRRHMDAKVPKKTIFGGLTRPPLPFFESAQKRPFSTILDPQRGWVWGCAAVTRLPPKWSIQPPQKESRYAADQKSPSKRVSHVKIVIFRPCSIGCYNNTFWRLQWWGFGSRNRPHQSRFQFLSIIFNKVSLYCHIHCVRSYPFDLFYVSYHFRKPILQIALPEAAKPDRIDCVFLYYWSYGAIIAHCNVLDSRTNYRRLSTTVSIGVYNLANSNHYLDFCSSMTLKTIIRSLWLTHEFAYYRFQYLIVDGFYHLIMYSLFYACSTLVESTDLVSFSTFLKSGKAWDLRDGPEGSLDITFFWKQLGAEDTWGVENLDLHGIKTHRGIFCLIKGADKLKNGVGPFSIAERITETEWIIRVCTFHAHSNSQRNFWDRATCSDPFIGDMLRSKRQKESRSGTQNRIFRFDRRRDKGWDRYADGRDQLIFCPKRSKLKIHLEDLQTRITRIGINFPDEVWTFYYDQVFYASMHWTQRAAFLDIINLLTTFIEQIEVIAKTEWGATWDLSYARFYMCFFCTILSADRILEPFLVLDSGHMRCEVTRDVVDLLHSFFISNLKGSNRTMWKQILGTKEGVNFVRWSGFGQLWNWLDGHYEARKDNLKINVSYNRTVDSNFWVPQWFRELCTAWDLNEAWKKDSLRIRRPCTTYTRKFLKHWETLAGEELRKATWETGHSGLEWGEWGEVNDIKWGVVLISEAVKNTLKCPEVLFPFSIVRFIALEGCQANGWSLLIWIYEHVGYRFSHFHEAMKFNEPFQFRDYLRKNGCFIAHELRDIDLDIENPQKSDLLIAAHPQELGNVDLVNEQEMNSLSLDFSVKGPKGLGGK